MINGIIVMSATVLGAIIGSIINCNYNYSSAEKFEHIIFGCACGALFGMFISGVALSVLTT